MSIHRIITLGAIVLVCLAACSVTPGDSLPGNTVPTREAIALPTNTAPTRETIALPTNTSLPTATPTPTADPAMSFVGTYQFRPTGEETFDYYLVLNQDGTALIEEKPIGSEPAGAALSVDATGNWYLDGDAVVFELVTAHGEPAAQQETIRIQFEGGFPIISDIKVGDKFVHLEDAAFSIGAGEHHPLVPELNRRLAHIQWLGFSDPGTDVYGEETRQAVVAFQEAEGLLPNGVVDAETWLLLDNPKPPLPTPTPLPSTAGRITSVPNLDDLPDHTGDGQPILYLTFDDGPLPQNTSPLLELLDQHDAQVTFFNVGSNVKKFPELVRECASWGHYIADHTWDHASMEGMSHEKLVDELERTRQAILDAAGDLFTLDRNVRYVRPPYGATDANTRQYAAELGFAVVLWNVDTQDWRRPGAKAIASHLLSHAKPGAIILMHDGGGDRSQTIEALKIALPQLQEQGYVFRNIFLP